MIEGREIPRDNGDDYFARARPTFRPRLGATLGAVATLRDTQNDTVFGFAGSLRVFGGLQATEYVAAIVDMRLAAGVEEGTPLVGLATSLMLEATLGFLQLGAGVGYASYTLLPDDSSADALAGLAPPPGQGQGAVWTVSLAIAAGASTRFSRRGFVFQILYSQIQSDEPVRVLEIGMGLQRF